MTTAQKYRIPGPWDQEPDQQEWTDDKTGLLCRILRNQSGCWCGYVQIPKGHPLDGVAYNADLPASLQVFWDSIMDGQVGKRGVMDVLLMAGGMQHAAMLFNVHGSVTFSGALRDCEGFWYGFDCGHCDDLAPAHAISFWGEYRDIDYVRGECASLAQQIKALAS